MGQTNVMRMRTMRKLCRNDCADGSREVCRQDCTRTRDRGIDGIRGRRQSLRASEHAIKRQLARRKGCALHRLERIPARRADVSFLQRHPAPLPEQIRAVRDRLRRRRRTRRASFRRCHASARICLSTRCRLSSVVATMLPGEQSLGDQPLGQVRQPADLAEAEPEVEVFAGHEFAIAAERRGRPPCGTSPTGGGSRSRRAGATPRSPRA